MREIKFRSFCKEKKLMLYDYSQKSAKEYGLRLGASIREMVFNVGIFDETLMQFTGLKDKNGKEIYEGDILSFCDRIGHVLWNGFNFDVTQNPLNQDESLGYKISIGLTKSFHELYLLDSNSSKPDYEIIGNIYENPELLTK